MQARGADIEARDRARALARRYRAVVRRLVILIASLGFALLALVSLGAAVGRFHVVPVDPGTPAVHPGSDSVAIVVPVPRLRLREGDTVMARVGDDRHNRLYKVFALDSWTHDAVTRDARGKTVKLRTSDDVARVSRLVPYVGPPFRLLVGIPQTVTLLLVAMLLLMKAALQRRARHPELAPLYRRMVLRFRRDERYARRRDGAMRRPWWWTRLAGVTLWTLGVLSLTASATFTASVTDSQAITAGHMGFAALGANDSATNRLTLAASGIAPGDVMARALDLSVDGTTTAGIMSGIKLQISATNGDSKNLGTDGTDGLKVFVQSCAQGNGSSGWAETGSSPAYTYACSTGSPTLHDLLNSSEITPPSVGGTCSETASGYHPISDFSTAQSLVHLPTLSASTTIHMVVTLCFPNNAGNGFQDATTTLTFTFSAQQRSGAAA